MRGGVYRLADTVSLQGTRDSFITIRNYQEEEVTLSGGVLLDLDWQQQDGNILSGEFEGECGELYLGEFRMLKARAPNIANYGVNKHFSTGPYHRVAGFLVENEDCQVDSGKFSQDCPEENRNGFYLHDEMSPDWEDLDQTQIQWKVPVACKTCWSDCMFSRRRLDQHKGPAESGMLRIGGSSVWARFSWF